MQPSDSLNGSIPVSHSEGATSADAPAQKQTSGKKMLKLDQLLQCTQTFIWEGAAVAYHTYSYMQVHTFLV